MRGRNRGKSHNPLTRVYESNGPDVKIRGTANHVAEKYIQLARDATASGDPVAAENYYQHAEHYFRLIAAAQEQFRQNQPFQQQPRPEGGGEQRADDNFDDGDESMQPHSGGGEPHSPRDQQQPYPQQSQPYQQRDQQQPYQPREHQQQNRDHQQRDYQQNREHQQHQPRPDNRPQQAGGGEGNDVSGLPSFITGGQAPQNQGYGQQNGYDNQPDRFPLHRRRRRGHRGPRPDMPGGQQGMSGGDGPDDLPAPSNPGQPPANE